MIKDRVTIISSDGYQIDVWVFNPVDYSSHVFVCQKVGERVNSVNHDLITIHGRDTYDCFMSDAPFMTRSEIIRTFDSWLSFAKY